MPRVFVSVFRVFATFVATGHLARSNLVGVKVEAQFLRLASLERDGLFLRNGAAAAFQFHANGITFPALASAQAGGAEDAFYTADCEGGAGREDA